MIRKLVLVSLSAVVCLPAAGASSDAVGRLLRAVTEYLGVVPSPEHELRAACGADPACAVARLDPAISRRLRLERVTRPDTDTIRWAKTRRSVSRAGRLDAGTVLVALDRFGRKAAFEIDGALAPHGDGDRLVLDLRANAGGDFARMLRIAGMFAGAREDALALVDGARRRSVALPSAPPTPAYRRLTVLVGPRTASSGEVLAALLRRHAKAEILGTRTAGKDFVYRVVPLSHDWRLLVAGARIEVPGETLAGGVVPDGPLPDRLARLLRLSSSR